MCLVSMHAIEIRKGLLPLKANLLFVSIIFMLENVFVRFPAFLNFNIMCNFQAKQNFAYVG